MLPEPVVKPYVDYHGARFPRESRNSVWRGIQNDEREMYNTRVDEETDERGQSKGSDG